MKIYKHFLSDAFSAITSFGSPVFYIFLVLVMLRFNVSWTWKMFFALIFIEFFCVLIKLIYKKDRPEAQARDDLFNMIDANSFPSVHSARISFIAVLFGLYFGDTFFIIFPAVLALLVGYSRIYLKRHHPSDVLVGFFIGIITALLIWIF